jgi:hypothetical protein
MKVKELNEGIYKKLVNLDYSRKENYLYKTNETEWCELDGEIKDTILSFPILQIDWYADLMDIEVLDGDQQFYLFESEGRTFLVDTQGYNYPRYIIELKGFNGVDDTYERMDGLVRIADVAILKSVVKSLAFDLQEEGFDRADIINFIDAQIYGALLEK